MYLSILPQIDGDGFFGIWPAASTDNAKQFVDIKGDMTKGDAQTPHLLRVGMPTAEERGIVAAQELPYNVIWRLGKNDLVKRTR